MSPVLPVESAVITHVVAAACRLSGGLRMAGMVRSLGTTTSDRLQPALASCLSTRPVHSGASLELPLLSDMGADFGWPTVPEMAEVPLGAKPTARQAPPMTEAAIERFSCWRNRFNCSSTSTSAIMVELNDCARAMPDADNALWLPLAHCGPPKPLAGWAVVVGAIGPELSPLEPEIIDFTGERVQARTGSWL